VRTPSVSAAQIVSANYMATTKITPAEVAGRPDDEVVPVASQLVEIRDVVSREDCRASAYGDRSAT
jgi:hypothetical protein